MAKVECNDDHCKNNDKQGNCNLDKIKVKRVMIRTSYPNYEYAECQSKEE